jgi:hypothetical protein
MSSMSSGGFVEQSDGVSQLLSSLRAAIVDVNSSPSALNAHASSAQNKYAPPLPPSWAAMVRGGAQTQAIGQIPQLMWVNKICVCTDTANVDILFNDADDVSTKSAFMHMLHTVGIPVSRVCRPDYSHRFNIRTRQWK